MHIIPLNIERELSFTRGDNTQTGKLILSRLEFVEDRNAWACYWSLDFIKPGLSRLWGQDPLEALTTTLWVAYDLIRDSGYPDLQVWWHSIGDYGGLPQITADEAMRNRRAPQPKKKDS